MIKEDIQVPNCSEYAASYGPGAIGLEVRSQEAELRETSTGEEGDRMLQGGTGRRPTTLQRKALWHAMRIRIIAACTGWEVTPKEFADAEGKSLRLVSMHFVALEKAGYLKAVREEMVRGARRVFYIAIQQAVITDEEFAEMPPKLRREVSQAITLDLLASMKEALRVGTLDRRTDSHFSWGQIEVDEEGWGDWQGLLSRVLERADEIQAESLARIRKDGGTRISTTFALAGFESPSPATRDSGRVPRPEV